MHRVLAWPGEVAAALMSSAGAVATRGRAATPALAPTPRSEIAREGTARLYHFHRPDDPQPAAPPALPLLIVPSLINRWYVMDLRRGASFVEALTAAGVDTWCLDWGVPEDEDRYLSWDALVARLARMVRRIKRDTGAPRVGVLGYCMGATLSSIYTAMHPGQVAALINLAGPIDFSAGGTLARLVDRTRFDADAIADAGNVSPLQMQSGFVALRPTLELAKWVGLADRAHDPAARESFQALETWAGDNIPFPGEAYRTYIKDLYQDNGLIARTHRVGGKLVDLAAITCPVMTIVAERDAICPPAAATALNERCGSADTTVLSVPGGHVGAVVGSRAASSLYPQVAAWLRQRLGA